MEKKPNNLAKLNNNIFLIYVDWNHMLDDNDFGGYIIYILCF